MIIDGRRIADTIKRRLVREVADFSRVPEVALIQVGNHPAIDSYVRIKSRFAKAIGVGLMHKRLDAGATTEDVLAEIDLVVRSEHQDGSRRYDGLIVQLPLPDHIDTDRVLAAIPRELDSDVLSPAAAKAAAEDGVLPPVAGAVRAILRDLRVNPAELGVVVVGQGKLVGQPVIDWLRAQGIDPVVVTETDGDLAAALQHNYVVITGVGSPHLITPEMVSAKHVLIDAGTSESSGVVVGDISPDCAAIVRAMTPVPGGVGPITIAILFQNLVTRLQSKYADEA